MSRVLFAVVVGLGLPGALPAFAVVRRSPALVFLAPLMGAGMAAVAAELELAVAGSLLTCYLVVAATANVAVVAWWLVGGRFPPQVGPPWPWSIVTVVVLLGAMVLPLTGLRAGIIGYDGNVIWLTHTLMMSGGHHELLTGLQNVAYRFANPDYPPLVPAAGALAFALVGHGDLRVAAEVTALLNACALGVVGVGVAAVASGGRTPSRIAAVVAAGAVCMVGFSVTECYYAVGGYADLLWSASAMGAVVWGLVLARSTQALVVAWICAAVAGLTKNEGLAVALLLLTLITLRYRPVAVSWPRRPHADPDRRRSADGAVWPVVRTWAERAAFVVVPALPGLAWAGLAHLRGLQDAFFTPSATQSAATESPLSRAAATVSGMAAHLTVALVALAVLAVGCPLLRRDRERAGLGNPAWLWTAWVLSSAIIFATYVLGVFPITWWLRTTVNRTTVFAQLAAYTDLAVWMVIAFGVGAARLRRERREVPAPPAPAHTNRPRTYKQGPV